MENTTTTPRSQLSVALRYAIICGLITIVYSLVLYLLKLEADKTASWLNYIILIVIMFLGIKDYRDKDLAGFIPFGKAFSTGLLIAFLTAIIYAVYNFIFISFIDPQFMANILAKQIQVMQTQGYTQEQIDNGMKMGKMFTSPAAITIFIIIGYSFFGLIIALIEALTLKKDNPEMPQV